MQEQTMSAQHPDWSEIHAIFGRDTNVGKFFQLLQNAGERSDPDSTFSRRYLPIVEETLRTREKVFLSILTRTQGRRPQELREVFLCLSAQTDMDFEILLIGHKVSEEQEKLIRSIIDEQTEDIRNRVRFLTVDYGNRTAPLNFGFAHARGEYVAILDDDDVVFDDWVEEFHAAARKHPGTLLHAYVAHQQWMKLNKGRFQGAVRACSSPNPMYCKPFSWPRQMHRNNCPTIGLAFPAAVFQQLGMIFDESLTTTEDWDYLQRVATLSGVTDIKKVTCIYRWWINTESSQTAHSKVEWNYNAELIHKKMLSRITLFPESGSRQILDIFCPPSVLEQYMETEEDQKNFVENLHFQYIKEIIGLYLKNKCKKMIGNQPDEIVHFRDIKKIIRLYIDKKKIRKVLHENERKPL